MPEASKNFIILKQVDSTNNYAMALIQNGDAINETAVFAREQTAGKGRRGKQWESVKDSNIIISIILKMQWLQLNEQFQLSVAVALACTDFFDKYVANDVTIKWPNDIFINDSKAGGVLIENQIKGNLWQWAVVGIGLNINQQTFCSNTNPVSLKKITHKHYNVIQLAHELHEKVIARINDLQKLTFTQMLGEYNQKLFRRDKMVQLKKGDQVFETQIEKVSATGELITRDEVLHKFKFDEVEWMNLYS